MSRRAAPHRGLDVHYGNTEDEDSESGRASKSEMKRQAHALQTLGEELAALSDDALARIEMGEGLRDAIEMLRRTRSHEGRRRQAQLVGKMMRSADEAALREALAAATVGTARESLLLHEIERWRAQLMAGDEALTLWLQEHPEIDGQHLRSLVRAARRDAAKFTPEQRQPKSFRELFQFIKPYVAIPA